MKSWQVLFKMDKAGEKRSQGGSTGADEDFTDEAADDAAAEEGAAEIGDRDSEYDEEEAEEDPEEERSEEEEDLEEETEAEEEEELEEEAPAPAGFKFKDPKTGDFDFKRINKAVGGDDLEKYFKESTATITRTTQELKAIKEEVGATPEERKLGRNKQNLLDHLMATNPRVNAEVMRFLNGGGPVEQEETEGELEIPGLNPDDPVAKPLLGVLQTVKGLQNRLQQEDQRRQQAEQQRRAQERDRQFVQGVRAARAAFKEQIGREATEEEVQRIGQEMQNMGLLNGAPLVPHLFLNEIRQAERARILAARKVKQKLPKGGQSRRVGPSTKKKSREEVRDELWEKHMNDGSDD